MSLVPYIFNEVALKVVTGDGKECCRAKEVPKVLDYQRKTGNVIKEHCNCENIAQKYQLIIVTTTVISMNCPKDSKKFDLYINEEGLYELVFSSQQALAKIFRKHCCNVIFPHIQQQLIKESIEEKKPAFALISDDFYESKKQMAESQREMSKLKEDTVDLQDAVERLERPVVPHLEDTRKDNGIAIIQENNGDH